MNEKKGTKSASTSKDPDQLLLPGNGTSNLLITPASAITLATCCPSPSLTAQTAAASGRKKQRSHDPWVPEWSWEAFLTCRVLSRWNRQIIQPGGIPIIAPPPPHPPHYHRSLSIQKAADSNAGFISVSLGIHFYNCCCSSLEHMKTAILTRRTSMSSSSLECVWLTAAALYEQAVKPVLVFMSLYKMVLVEEVCNFSFTTLTIRVAPLCWSL